MLRRMATLLTLTIITGCGGPADDAPETPALNVVFLVVDSLRADHLGAYGYDKPTSPFLDELAAESVVFNRAYAPSSYTSQSVAALLTGRLPSSGGHVGLLEAQPSEQAKTISSLFRTGGFHTGIVSNQFLLKSRGFTRGFEFIQVADQDSGWTADDVTERSLMFVDDYQRSGPFFLFAHFLEPHQPYAPPPEYAEKFGGTGDSTTADIDAITADIEAGNDVGTDDPRVQALIANYNGEIAYVDAAIRQLVDGLAERGVLENTMIVVTSSQGEEFLEHNYLGHAWTLHEEVLRVPLMVRAPNYLPAKRIDDPVSGIDIYPSLLEFFGLDAGDWLVDGASFLRGTGSEVQVRVPRAAKMAELVIRERCVLRAVIQDDWKYVAESVSCPLEERNAIRSEYQDRIIAMANGELEVPDMWAEAQVESFFNLTDDPAESQNLAMTADEARLDSMRGVLNNFESYCEANALAAREAAVPQQIDEEAAERLRSLGYL